MGSRWVVALLSALCSLASASVQIGSDWPAGPLGESTSARRVLLDAGGDAAVRSRPCPSLPPALRGAAGPLCPTPHRARRRQSRGPPPEGVGMFHIILWSSLGLVVVGWFAVLAMFNMDVGNDSLLYSKAKME